MPPFRQEPGTESFDPINDLEPVGEPLVKPQYAAKDDSVDEKGNFVARIVWRNVVLMIVLHATAMYGAMLCFTSAKWQTVVCAFIFYQLSGLGITAGAHRLWAHRSYKARLPLRIFLAFLQTMAFQNHIFEWARDHRVHHKYSETDADPHNARRGFFFAHVGWLMMKKHPEVISKGKTISMEDMLQDPVVRVQMKYYLPLVLVVCFLLPTYLPNMLWGETLWNGFFVCALFRYAFTLNMTWCVNSAAHFWGRHPYDNNIHPAENAFTILGAIGEGFHNYHHVFPWDYAASELGWRYNLSTAFINTMAVLGQAYELKQVSPDMIRKRKERTGDVHMLGDYGLYHPGDKFVETVDKDN